MVARALAPQTKVVVEISTAQATGTDGNFSEPSEPMFRQGDGDYDDAADNLLWTTTMTTTAAIVIGAPCCALYDEQRHASRGNAD